MNTSVLTKAALKAKKERGERLGRPPVGFAVGDDGELVATGDLVEVLKATKLRRSGLSYGVVAESMGWTKAKTYRITKRWEGRMDELLGFLNDGAVSA